MVDVRTNRRISCANSAKHLHVSLARKVAMILASARLTIIPSNIRYHHDGQLRMVADPRAAPPHRQEPNAFVLAQAAGHRQDCDRHTLGSTAFVYP